MTEKYHTFPLLYNEKEVANLDESSRDAYLFFVAREAIRLESDIKYLEEETERDPLTNCYTKKAFMNRLDDTLTSLRSESGRRETDIWWAAVIFIDVFQFKAINEQYGYSAGDQSLWDIVANTILAVRAEDIVGRYAGDEFMVSITGQGEANPHEVVKEIIHRINNNLAIHNANKRKNDPTIEVTMGYIVVGNDIKVDAEQVIERASKAMKKEKIRQRNAAGITPRQD